MIQDSLWRKMYAPVCFSSHCSFRMTHYFAVIIESVPKPVERVQSILLSQPDTPELLGCYGYH